MIGGPSMSDHEHDMQLTPRGCDCRTACARDRHYQGYQLDLGTCTLGITLADPLNFRVILPDLPSKTGTVLLQPTSCRARRHSLVHLFLLSRNDNPKLTHTMDLHELQNQFTLWRDEATYAFQKVPGSAVIIRYVRSSYQNDPVRSALELVLVIFVMHYLFAPSYSTKKNEIKLTEAVSTRLTPPGYERTSRPFHGD